MDNNNLGMFLKQIVDRNIDKPALYYGPGKPTEMWTYRQLWARTGLVARWLQEHGVQKGDRVVIWAPNSPWWVAAYFGTLRTGAILVPLDVHSGVDFAQKVTAQTEPKVAFVSKSTIGTWLELGAVKEPVTAFPLEDFANLPEEGPEPAEVDVTGEDVCEIVFTSGTTGKPKGVVLTHGGTLFDVEATDKYVPETPGFRTVSILPLSHTFEQSVGLLLALKRDASIFYITSIQPSVIFGALHEHGATTLLLTPRALQLFMSTIEREAAAQGKGQTFERMTKVAEHLPLGVKRRMFQQIHQRFGGRLDFLVSGGAPIEAELVHKWEAIGVPIIQGYGATETGPVVAASPMHDRAPSSVGKPLPGVEVRVAEDGELLVRGPNLMKGYWQNPEATKEAFEDGWYKTGDLGYFDSKGLLYLHGRKKDMIALSNGQKVYPQDVEQALIAVPGVADAVVVGLPSDQGQQVHAVLILKPEAPTPQEIIKQANAHLAPHQYVKDYTLWPDKEFPTTFTFKVKKQEVLARVIEMQVQEPQAEEASAVT